ncbi:MAG TPA: ATP-binding protein [Burkholderiales bacterium]|nr:ATP-binding protein [Burkholderiales bacterium]
MENKGNREPKEVESTLAHDLNNYLQVVMGNLEILRRRGVFMPELVNAALNATRNAAHLADRLVAMGRLQHHDPRTLDLNRALTDLNEMLGRILGDGVRVEMDLAEGLAPVLADARCLQLALLEIATNARDAMPTGGRMSIRTASAERGLVSIALTDTGAGMAADAIPHAFNPVFSTGDGVKPARLGLHIVDCCMRQAGGRVELSSQPSRGTTVTLYLPTA